jgi:hypothetical protein
MGIGIFYLMIMIIVTPQQIKFFVLANWKSGAADGRVANDHLVGRGG